ncbi:MAG: DUF2798 domain-containing protein [Halomonas sp.]|jgi:hypothetical protein|nr:DUF2798 domain-containing protein [Halomonas sp.]MDM7482572.1 DUF2798 domain-containing protein [Halomonas sp.]
MFDPKYAQLIFSCLMALFMSCIMSLVITLYNVGLVDGIVLIWLKASTHEETQKGNGACSSQAPLFM